MSAAKQSAASTTWHAMCAVMFVALPLGLFVSPWFFVPMGTLEVFFVGWYIGRYTKWP